MTIGFQLWYLLRYPPVEHPIFQRCINADMHKGTLSRRMKIAIYGLIAVILFLAFFVSRTLFLVLLVGTPFFLIGGFVVSSGSFYGIWRGIQTGRYLATLAHDDQHDTLFLLPPGEIGVVLLGSAGYLHRRGYLHDIHQIVLWLMRIMLVAVGSLALLLLLATIALPQTTSGENSTMLILAGVVPLGTLAAIVYLDFVFSIVIATLITGIVAQVTSQKLEAQLWTGGFFITLQLLQYAILGLMLFLCLWLAQVYTLMNAPIRIMLAVVTVLIFYLVREAFTGILWRILLSQTGTSWREWGDFRVWWQTI